jgi:hypothetical protein
MIQDMWQPQPDWSVAINAGRLCAAVAASASMHTRKYIAALAAGSIA